MNAYSRSIDEQRVASINQTEEYRKDMKNIVYRSQAQLNRMDREWTKRMEAMSQTIITSEEVRKEMQQSFEDEKKIYMKEREREIQRSQDQFNLIHKLLTSHIENTTSSMTNLYHSIEDIRHQMRSMSKQLLMHLYNQSKLIE